MWEVARSEYTSSGSYSGSSSSSASYSSTGSGSYVYDGYKTIESPQVMFEEGKDITCSPELISVTEIIHKTTDEQFYINSDQLLTGSNVIATCSVAVRTLDGQHSFSYNEIKFNSPESAKFQYDNFVAEKIIEAIDDSSEITLNSGVRLWSQQIDGNFETNYFFDVKDEFVLVVIKQEPSINSEFEKYFITPWDLSKDVVQRIHPEYITEVVDGNHKRLDACTPLIDEKFIESLVPENFEITSGKLSQQDYGPTSILGVEEVCMSILSIPSFIEPSQKIIFSDIQFFTDDEAATVFDELWKSTNNEFSAAENVNMIDSDSFSMTYSDNAQLIVKEKNHLIQSTALTTPYSILNSDDTESIVRSMVNTLRIPDSSVPYADDPFDLVKKSPKKIPEWIRNNAAWWSDDIINDSDFVSGIQYMIKEKIIDIHDLPKVQNSDSQVPAWVKTTVGFWADGQISDGEFVNALKHLVKTGIIQVT